MKFETNYEMKATCLFRSCEWRTMRRRRCRRMLSSCVSFNLFHFIFFLSVSGKWILFAIFVALLQHFILACWASGCAGVCVHTIVLCVSLWEDACVQITATGCSQVSCVVIVHCVKNKRCDDLNLFLNWQRPTDRSGTSGTIVWCVLGASHAMPSLDQWMSKWDGVRVCVCAHV